MGHKGLDVCKYGFPLSVEIYGEAGQLPSSALKFS